MSKHSVGRCGFYCNFVAFLRFLLQTNTLMANSRYNGFGYITKGTMLGSEFLIFAVILRVLAGLDYLLATLKGEAQPNPVTWLFWGLAPLVAFVAQIQKTIEPSAWVTLALSAGPLLIFIVSLTKRQRWKIGPFDILCGASAAVGIVLWQVTSDPVMAMVFGILADILGGIPTVVKSYAAPSSEKATPYLLSVASMVLTLATIQSWRFIDYAFPVYILLINLLLFTLISTRIGERQTKILDNTPVRRR